MRNGKCPKCSSQVLFKISGKGGPQGVGNWIPVGWFSAISVTRYLCRDCGFSEEWVESPEDRKMIAEKFPGLSGPSETNHPPR